jgi:hypothetical protein
MRKIITVSGILIVIVIAIAKAYAGGPGTGGCVWPTNPNSPCVFDDLPSQPT